MKKIALKGRNLVMLYLKWGWPLLCADAAFEIWAGAPTSLWRTMLNDAAFAWVLCAPAAPLTLLLDRSRRERAMSRLCGLREGDERERLVTAEAARSTLLLALSAEVIMLVLTMVSVNLVWNPAAPKGAKHGLLQVGMSFSSARHLDPFGAAAGPQSMLKVGDTLEAGRSAMEFGGYVLSPSAFPILALLILVQLAAFKGFALRQYEGIDV
ncbi:MAG: hypothetical protein A2V88_12555 [Elusimicrobia bacterium RBG_16_66_12]|nr:MAG: hypothetical protein A2V88_12555 [Elusimicrobia bacterium RBG_16_66_12]